MKCPNHRKTKYLVGPSGARCTGELKKAMRWEYGRPDEFTQIPWRNKATEDCPDGPRYKALGNSMAVNCMRWIGRRIEMVEVIQNEQLTLL